MKFPLISVIVPIYNEEKNIARCIDSLLNQNYTSFEVLLIDDGSQDNSGIIIDKYADNFPIVRVFHKKNGGVSSARNWGLKESHGEWVTFCDADDYVKPDWLRLFAMQVDDQTELIVQPFFQSGLVSEEGKDFEGDVVAFLEDYFEKPMIGSPCNKLYSLSLIRKHQLQFNESFRLCEDTDFLVHYLIAMNKNTTIVHTLSGGYCYAEPDFSAKYHDVENYFETLLSIYTQIRHIHQDSFIPKTYGNTVKFMTHALWDLFLRNSKKAYESLNVYHQEVGADVMCIKNFPLAFRIILCMPSFISFPCLRIMGKLMSKDS